MAPRYAALVLISEVLQSVGASEARRAQQEDYDCFAIEDEWDEKRVQWCMDNMGIRIVRPHAETTQAPTTTEAPTTTQEVRTSAVLRSANASESGNGTQSMMNGSSEGGALVINDRGGVGLQPDSKLVAAASGGPDISKAYAPAAIVGVTALGGAGIWFAASRSRAAAAGADYSQVSGSAA
mmetsp:Transcript_45976/g.129330  ORF Transcript_45976/g.129330 Transcript_45976/m.129330 type:complete len:181 (+) Transcript_45976:73-615(+)